MYVNYVNLFLFWNKHPRMYCDFINIILKPLKMFNQREYLIELWLNRIQACSTILKQLVIDPHINNFKCIYKTNISSYFSMLQSSYYVNK